MSRVNQTASRFIVEAGRVVAPDRDLTPGHVIVDKGKVREVRSGRASDATYRFPDGIVAPGFIDLQVNGGAGVDFLRLSAEQDVLPALTHLASTGVSAFLPTVITAPVETMRNALRIISRAAETARPRILGAHLEGPFLSPAHPGAHDPEALQRPSGNALARLVTGFEQLVRLVTLAPELPGADEVIRELRRQNVTVAAGHTEADYDTALQGFSHGVSMVTHLFNAMPVFHHRAPGIVGAALTEEDVAVSLILDGFHLHPAAAALALRVLGPGRTVLVSDAMAAAGAPPGRYPLGMREVVYDGTAPRLESGRLAGSELTMDRAVAAVSALGWSTRDAVLMATRNPAHVLGLQSKGTLSPGTDADLGV
jgi:N-acetylglucosamine-6-phosphate deacetylase